MFKLAASIFDFLSYIPDILRESGNLFGVFALAAIIIAIIALLFFRNGEEKQKERIFLYTTLFLLSLIFASLFAGLSTGFQSGKEVAVADPTLVELSPTATQELENYLRSQGIDITEQNKSDVLSDAITEYTVSNPEPAIASTPEDSTADSENEPIPPVTDADDDSIPDGFRLDQKSCSQRAETIACDLLITNTTEDISITLFANGTYSDSRLVDSDGNQYIVNTIKVGNTENRNSEVVTFARNVPVRITLITSDATSGADRISLVELLASTGDRFTRAGMTFQARDVAITQ
ncbi:MAG: hypothetical protein AAF716_14375 [Cyanobacteria bacterium P01_D01_bin.1]